MNLNKAFILGNVTRDPETRALPSGQSVVSFGIATNRFYTDNTGAKKQDAEFHNIVAFGKLADICSRYLTKGSLVFIEGRLKTRSWQNASGIKQFKTEIIANNIQLGPRSTGGFSPRPAGGMKNEDIPIIEENYTPPATDVSSEETPDNLQETNNDNDEIDISKIPF